MSHFNKIWWIENQILGGMPQPKLSDIPELYSNGLRAVASFLESQENLTEYKNNNIQTYWLPVIDDMAPSLEQIIEFTTFVEKMKTENKPVAVHCKGGNGRAGTMLAGYYISKGRDSHEVLSWIRKINPKAIRTKVQEDFLHSLSVKKP